MPVLNPVNDADKVCEAVSNCALCTICGVLDKGNYTSCTKALRSNFPKNWAPPSTVDEMLGAYWEGEQQRPPASNGRETLDHQVNGLLLVLSRIKTGGAEVIVDLMGSSDQPLALDDARTLMEACPSGTRFAYMIGRWEVLLGPGQITAAHWLTAELNDDGLKFIDYQMDVMEKNRCKVSRLQHVRPSRLNAPQITDGPMRAFGEPPDPETDVAVVISYTRVDG
ncbi:MAG: hypothetical protein ABJF07_07930 [Nisaea sp.]|uniref:hypothetical protein n=1 Tax=Nisaea sp. TaxID=2024842 RepID=UPI003267CCC1